MTAALVLVGHGSSRHPEAAQPLLDLARAVRGRGRFAEVAACFFKNPPDPAAVLAGLSAADVVVVPVFAGKGHYTDVLIPRACGLSGPAGAGGGRRIVVTPPVGAHPRLPSLLAARAVAAAGEVDPAGLSVLLLAHGSSRPGGGAAETPRAVAAALAAMGRFAEIGLGFLEQEPRAADWPDLVKGREVVALPLLVAQGMHASEDIPPLFGLAAGEHGPVEAAGRRGRLAAGLGAEPDLADIILELADAALG